VVTRKRGIDLELVGGDPALDFANTLDGPREDPLESLHDYGDLVAWAEYAGVLDAATAERLATADDAASTRAYDRALSLRGAIRDTFSAVAAGAGPQPDALAALLATHAEAVSRARFTSEFTLTWESRDPERVVWPLAVAAVDLLRNGPLDRIKACRVCPWLFIDASRNRSRRWCSMNECGGRDKMRRYRARRATAGR
jgi:predicted RNA-binding Zn ribbon-like protein